jgi:hypothetical protein
MQAQGVHHSPSDAQPFAHGRKPHGRRGTPEGDPRHPDGHVVGDGRRASDWATSAGSTQLRAGMRRGGGELAGGDGECSEAVPHPIKNAYKVKTDKNRDGTFHGHLHPGGVREEGTRMDGYSPGNL